MIIICDENVLYDLLNKYNFLIFLHSACFIKIVQPNPSILKSSVPNVKKIILSCLTPSIIFRTLK